MAASIRLLLTAFDYRPRLGGVATCAFETARALSMNDGVSVTVLAPSSADLRADAAFDAHGNFTTRRVKTPGMALAALAPLSWHVSAEVRRLQPHAVLNFLWMPCGIATWFSRKIPFSVNLPYFVVAHGVEVIESKSNFKKKIRSKLAPLKARVFRDASAVFSVSHFTGSLVQELCDVPEERIKVMYNGVDSNAFSKADRASDLVSQYGLEGRRVLLTISRLDDYKGVDYALRALRRTAQEFPEVIYLVCGDGPDRARLERLTRDYGLSSHVIFTGTVPPDRLNDYYNLCEAFVLLSRYDQLTPNFEGFGIVFLEAAACGKPSIAGNSGGIPDAVAHGESGLLVDPTNEDEIAKAFREVLSNPERTRTLGAAAERRARERFAWQNVADVILNEVKRHVRD